MPRHSMYRPAPRASAVAARLLPWLLFAVSVPAASAEAQVLRGRLLDAGTDSPIGAATVHLMVDDSVEVGSGTTNGDGWFEIRAPAPGEYFLIAFALGYDSAVTERFDLQPPGRAIRIAVTPRPIPLDPVAGEAVAIRPYSRNQRFYDRMRRRNSGRFITREQIERRNPIITADMLRNVPGLRVAMVRGQAVIEAAHPTSFQDFLGGGRCLANIYIDGMLVGNSAINSITPAEIEGFEIYTNTAAIPAEFNSSQGAACGVVVIWTRGGFEPDR
jgi:hypothetical protein